MAGRRLNNARLAKPVWRGNTVPGRFEPSEGEVARRAYPGPSRWHVGAFCGVAPRSDDASRPETVDQM